MVQSNVSCSCISGWTGSFCSIPDFCYSSPCGKHGACKNRLGSYHCICDTQWLGDTCQVNACENITCSHHGICSADLSTLAYHCECTDGWIGHNCDIPDPCQTNICENEGTCFPLELNHANSLVNLALFNNLDTEIINGSVTAECKCIKEWTGPRCEIDVDECLIKTRATDMDFVSMI